MGGTPSVAYNRWGTARIARAVPSGFSFGLTRGRPLDCHRGPARPPTSASGAAGRPAAAIAVGEPDRGIARARRTGAGGAAAGTAGLRRLDLGTEVDRPHAREGGQGQGGSERQNGSTNHDRTPHLRDHEVTAEPPVCGSTSLIPGLGEGEDDPSRRGPSSSSPMSGHSRGLRAVVAFRARTISADGPGASTGGEVSDQEARIAQVERDVRRALSRSRARAGPEGRGAEVGKLDGERSTPIGPAIVEHAGRPGSRLRRRLGPSFAATIPGRRANLGPGLIPGRCVGLGGGIAAARGHRRRAGPSRLHGLATRRCSRRRQQQPGQSREGDQYGTQVVAGQGRHRPIRDEGHAVDAIVNRPLSV